MTIRNVKKAALSGTLLPLAAIAFSAMFAPSITATQEQPADAATVYKKCAGCHGAKAEKAFDPAKPEEQLVEAVLKGVKGKMPGYEKSVGAEQAKALVAHMKQLRQ